MEKRDWIIILGLVVLFIVMLVGVPFMMKMIVQQTVSQVMSPVENAGEQLKTQVSSLLNPTPTIIPDPSTIIYELRSLARLETIQYSMEKVITAEINQEIGFLFGDRILFVAHGIVIAGIDLNQNLELEMKNDVLYLTLPEPEIFIATLDNEKSYVYDRETGILSRGDPNLETAARRAAEEEIRKAALEDGILELARQNADNYLLRLLRGLGYEKVIIDYKAVSGGDQ